jgi:hypothetical protein
MTAKVCKKECSHPAAEAGVFRPVPDRCWVKRRKVACTECSDLRAREEVASSQSPTHGGLLVASSQRHRSPFVVSDTEVWGRPVGVAAAHDGSLLVTIDGSGKIWRVAHHWSTHSR